MTQNKPVTYKLQKMLAQAGLGSRRDMEVLIESGRVTLNGKIAMLGARVDADDEVCVDKRSVKLQFDNVLPRILIYHKPEGEIVSRADPEGRASVFDQLPKIDSGKWVAVGRLDYNTSGLLIFTDSGELANQLMHPRFEVEREYAVRILGRLKPEQIRQLKKGIALEDGLAKVESIADQGGEGANHWYHAVLKEGRNRIVRRIFAALGFTVSRLMRVRFGKIRLPPDLKRGHFVELHPKQTAQVLAWAGGKKP
ncbi:MAG: pseudouridine synthase [Burkholderiales bacterium]